MMIYSSVIRLFFFYTPSMSYLDTLMQVVFYFIYFSLEFIFIGVKSYKAPRLEAYLYIQTR